MATDLPAWARRADVLHNITHELSTPLTPIVGYLKLLQHPEAAPLNDLQRRAIASMESCAARLQAVIDDLLAVSRIQSGEMGLEREHVQLSGVVHAVLVELSGRADELSVTVDRLLQEDDQPLRIDPAQITDAIRHVVANAVKFTGEGGRVRVELMQDASRTTVRVFDSGVGIRSAEQEAVFEPFYQVDSSRPRRHSGLGLGLALARHAVAAHGGRLTLESPPRAQPTGHFFKGSLFTVELPNDDG